MSSYNNTGSRSGQSRAKGTTRSKSTSANGRGTSAKSRQTSSGRSTSSQARRKPSRNRKPDYDYKTIFIGGVILIIAIAVIAFLMKGIGKDKLPDDETETSTVEAETELAQEVIVDGITITGMSRESAKAEILKNYPWALTVTYNGEKEEITNLMAGKVDQLLQEIYAGEPQESYTLDTSGLEEQVQKEVDMLGERWDKKAKNGSISSYDSASDKFLFTGAENGFTIDREALKNDIMKAIEKKTFDAAITASGSVVEPEFSEAAARERYKTIGTFTTTTTANKNRNNNINIASNILNGTILQPGQEFSFNDTVGERTEAKGYKGAAAYNNGLVVEEIGGGVCQVSSTLYNVVIKAGLKTTVRRSHTFEPSYVTPGTDATISWGGPDYKFVNNSSAAIGIRASYADQKMTISIYGIPVLEEGVTQSLQSKKVKDIDSPAPTYEEDQTLQPDEEKVKNAGSLGSYWETRLVVKKGDQIISDKLDHETTYKGHAAVILRNTSGVVVTTEGESPTIESSSPASEGAGDGFTGNESSGSSEGTGASGPEGGPGVTTPTSGSSGTGEPGNPTTAPTSPAPTTNAPTSPAPTTAGNNGPGTGQTPTTAAPDTTPTVAPNPMGGSGNSQVTGGGPGQ